MVTLSVEKAQSLQTAVSIFKQPSKTDKFIFDDGDKLNGISSGTLNTEMKTNIDGEILSTCQSSPIQHQEYILKLWYCAIY